ncbi:MAG: P-loop NTPase family protein [Candidatus Dormibacteria bacterium]
MDRIWVMGTTGSGKTTLARRLAGILSLPHTELDALFWDAGWQAATDDTFRERVSRVVDTERWVVDGNYRGRLGDYVCRASLVVWLDMSLDLILRRLVVRTVARRIGEVELWNGNRERIRDWFGADHPIWWAIRTHRERRANLELLMDERWVRLRSPAAVERWIREVAANRQARSAPE